MNRLDLIIDALERATELWLTEPIGKQALAAARELKELAQPEQKLNDPPAYVEPPTSDYHNGWEEGFEAAKNLFKKESAPQNADPRLLLGRKDNCIALAQPEQEPVCDKDPSLCGFTLCQLAKVCKHTPRNTMPIKIVGPNLEQILNAAGFYKREWVGLTSEDWENTPNTGKQGCERDVEMFDWIEQTLKDKNT